MENNSTKEIIDTAVPVDNDNKLETADTKSTADTVQPVAQNSNPTKKEESQKVETPFKKKAKAFFKKYFIDAFSGMAQGLFCTLIIGTIIKEIGKLICTAGTPAGYSVGNALIMLGSIASMLMGAGIGVGIAKSLKAPNLVMFTAAVAGMIGSYSMNFVNGTYWTQDAMLGLASLKLLPGNPIGAYICTVLAVEIGKKVSGTKIDIILVPFVVSIVALISIYIAWPFVKLVDYIGLGVAKATHVAPAPMGMIIAIVMGILLTLPTSSAAIWIAVSTPILGANATGVTPELIYAMQLAGGAAVVGCSCHMVGFAFASYRENGFGGAIAQGIGTSMLQIPNVMRKPRIMIPEIVASFILGPISTCGFKLLCGTSGGGMGTSGFVGVIDTINVSTAAGLDPALMWCGVIFLLFIFPALISFAVSELMRHFGWIKFGDQKLDVE